MHLAELYRPVHRRGNSAVWGCVEKPASQKRATRINDQLMRELTPPQAYEELTNNDRAVLVDCRTRAEWFYVGIPDLSIIGKQAVLESIADETGQPNANFITRIGEIASSDTPIYVICKIGGRSANACHLLESSGYSNVCNILEGFEGSVDQQGHRSSIDGWKFHNLPWRQS